MFDVAETDSGLLSWSNSSRLPTRICRNDVEEGSIVRASIVVDLAAMEESVSNHENKIDKEQRLPNSNSTRLPMQICRDNVGEESI